MNLHVVFFATEVHSLTSLLKQIAFYPLCLYLELGMTSMRTLN